MEFKHTSVLLHETIDNLNIRPDGIYVDGTLGGAGHSSEIVKRLNENGRLIGIDQDEDAIAAASERLKDYSDKVTIIRSNYCNMKEELNRIGVTKVNGILLDLGVSSFQLDTPERGFTYREEDAPLDMRMDQRQTLTAKDIVNDYSESELYRIIRDYGEDRFAKNIAKHIVKIHCVSCFKLCLIDFVNLCNLCFSAVKFSLFVYYSSAVTMIYVGDKSRFSFKRNSHFRTPFYQSL